MSKNINLSGNTLKIIALIAMTLDHAAVMLFDGCEPMRIIGRMAFPIFAFMIAEGCRYTKNRCRYFAGIFFTGALCQIVYYFGENSVYQGVLITFSLSILIIYSIQHALKEGTWISLMFPAAMVMAALFLCDFLPKLLWKTDYGIDYGFCGVMITVLIFLPKDFGVKLVLTFGALVLLCLSYGGIQWWSLVALLPLTLYSGQRGKIKMKYFFYIYYPLHLAVLYAVSAFV